MGVVSISGADRARQPHGVSRRDFFHVGSSQPRTECEPMTKRDKPIDWPGIEADFRAGTMSVREIGRWYGVTDAAIRKKAKQQGWVREQQPGHIEREPVVRATAPAKEPADLADKARGLAGRMMDELDAVTSLHGELEDMICSEESDPRRRQSLLKAISLGERAKTLKDVSTTLKTLNEAAAPSGKRAARQDRADKASSGGKFGVRSAPRLAVNNG